MLSNPHDTCAQIINTLRISGITYTLNETPYSVYLTLRKKFIKEYIPQPQHNTQEQGDKIKEHEDQIAQLQEALKNEIDQHNATKHQLSETEAEADKLDYINNMNIEESNKLHNHHIATIHELQSELGGQSDDHAKSEHALKQLEAEVEKLVLELKKKVNDEKGVIEKNECLNGKLEDAEQAIENLNSLTRSLNEKLLHYEQKQADLAQLDTAVLNAKVRELEDTVNGKLRIISHLEAEAKLSQNETDHLRQAHCHSVVTAHHGTQAHTPSQSGTLSGISQLGTDTLSTHIDKNCNPHPKSSSLTTHALIGSLSQPSTLSIQGSNTKISPTNSNHCPPSPQNHRNCEKFCQNCQNELPEDLDVTLPSPAYF